MIVGVRPAVESDVRAIVASASDRRVIVTEMAAAHVVVSSVDETVLCPVERLAEIGIKEIAARVSDQRLRAERRLFVNAETRIKSGELVILIDKRTVRR